MKKISSFINRYPLQKTLQFSLVPIGETEENFSKKCLLESDERRAENYSKVKKYIDRYHAAYIESVLSKTILTGIDDYAQLYFKKDKSDNEKKAQADCEASLRKKVATALKGGEDFDKLFKKEMIKELLPEFLTDAQGKDIVSEFSDFSTYFTGFHENRKNMYSDEEKSTSVSFRCINENLPKFLDNVRAFEQIAPSLPESDFKKMDSDFAGLNMFAVKDLFSVDYFSFVLSQGGIQQYNEILGGYTLSDGTKIQGLNEYINLYNQKLPKEDKSKRLPRLKPLFKQILSDVETISYIPEAFTSDDELLGAVNSFYTGTDGVQNCIDQIKTLFCSLNACDTSCIYLKNGLAVTELSNSVFGSWHIISDIWNAQYDAVNMKKVPKDMEKYLEKQRKAYKSIGSFSLAQLQTLGNSGASDIVEYFTDKIGSLADEIASKYSLASGLLSSPYVNKKRLYANDNAIALIKSFLDSIKSLENTIKPLLGTGKEEDKDGIFYGEFTPLFEKLAEIDRLYDKVRNYMTQKPYSKNKIKLNFDNPQFLGGWDRNKEADYRSVLLTKDGLYYLAVMDKSSSKAFQTWQAPNSSDVCYSKVNYKLLPGPNKMLPKVFFCNKNIAYYAPSDEILGIYKNETFKKGARFCLSDCRKLIDFYKDAISRHPDWVSFGFDFAPTESYADIGAFYSDIKRQGYKITYDSVPKSYIDTLVTNGDVYLFQIYNKDFSQFSKGTPNLHTLYFKMLFDERNLSDVVFQLNGGAEMFYRKASIPEDEKTVHHANTAVSNKNPLNPKPTSVFDYDIIKDRRFTVHQFSLHVPITLNFKAPGIINENEAVRRALKHCENNYVIGIDRGERNLLYVCVVNGSGEIVEQFSLNEIVNEYKGIEHRVNYHDMLDSKEKQRKASRQEWTTVESIKELKEGYISQVVHKICELVVKYDAVIAMEDLNSGFKNSRTKVEKQVYQKFEKMLIDKLNFLADKKSAPEAEGGLLNAYQLTNKFESFKKMGSQNGFIFYIPAWLTSKIDPSTGFVDLLKPRYTSVDATKEFFGKFDSISFNAKDNMFEFSFNYANFPKGTTDCKGSWVVCTNSDRILTFRNPAKNNEFDNKTIILTDEFKALFADFGIDIGCDLKQAICSRTEKDFFERLCRLLALTLQMRNSITGNTDVDYLISPVRNASGSFYDSRDYEKMSKPPLPQNADANGAFNIARKVLWAIDVLKATDDDELLKSKLSISNKEWLQYAQTGR